MRKQIIALILSLLLVTVGVFFLVSGGYGKLTKKKDAFEIHVILQTKSGDLDFWKSVEEGIYTAGQEFDVRCIIKGPKEENQIEEQIQMAQDSLDSKPDAIILSPLDYNALAPISEKISEADIPLVLLDSDVAGVPRTTIVQTDNYQVGKKLAELAVHYLPEDGTFAIVSHSEELNTTQDRLEGFLDHFPEKHRILEIVYSEGSAQKAKTLSLELIRKYPDISGLIGLSEVFGLGISRALDQQEREDIIHLTCDSSWEQIPYMEDGTIRAVILQHPFTMGYFSVEAAVRALHGEPVEPVIIVESKAITTSEMYLPENQKLLFPFMD